MTPDERLIKASSEASLEGVTSAIADGADVNTPDKHGWTAFMNATWNSDSNMMRMLRLAGANASLLSDDGYAAVHYAARAGRTSIIGQFTAEELNQPDADGLTPIFHAAIFGHRATFYGMIKHGANDAHKVKRGHTCYDYAWMFGNKVA